MPFVALASGRHGGRPGYRVFAPAPQGRDGAEVWQDLVDRSVLVRNCASWPRLEGCLRVTIGTRDEDDAFLAALTEVLR